MQSSSFVITLSCPDRVGIVHAVTAFLAERGANITEAAQSNDAGTGLFFMRVRFVLGDTSLAALRDAFGDVAAGFGMQWGAYGAADRLPTLIIVSKLGHCLNDLLFRHRAGRRTDRQQQPVRDAGCRDLSAGPEEVRADAGRRRLQRRRQWRALQGDDGLRPRRRHQQKNVAEYLRAQLKKIGIAVTVRTSADFPTWARRMASHDFDMSMHAAFHWGEPVIGVHRTYPSTNIRPIVWTNTQSYRNPQVDELLNSAGTILDPTRRKAYYATFQKIVTDELPVYVINQVPYCTATTKKVGNVPQSIWGTLLPFDEVYLK